MRAHTYAHAYATLWHTGYFAAEVLATTRQEDPDSFYGTTVTLHLFIGRVSFPSPA